MTAASVPTHHALEVTHPHLRNTVALAGDTVYPAWRVVRWVARFVRRLVSSAVDAVEAHLAGVMATLVGLITTVALTVIFVAAGWHLAGIATVSLGVLIAVFVVGYWTGGRG